MGAGPWLARRCLHPPTTASRMLALPGAIRQHARLPGAPPSWGQDLGLQDGVSTPQPRPAGCWRSQGRSGSTHDSRERRHLGGRTLACRTASPSPPTTASRMLALPGAIRQHARLPGAPPSWGQDLGLQDGASIPQPPPAGCWRSQGRSGSTHDSRERRHLGGRTLACKTASPPPQPPPAGCWRLPIDCQSRESCQTTGPALFEVLGR